MIACLDTNVLVSGIFWRGIPGAILDFWVEGRFELVISLPILEEYKRTLKDLGASRDPKLADTWIKTILEKTLFVEIPQILGKWSRDPDDDKFIDCALAMHADYLVSGDQDLLDLKGTVDIEIVSPREFLRLVESM